MKHYLIKLRIWGLIAVILTFTPPFCGSPLLFAQDSSVDEAAPTNEARLKAVAEEHARQAEAYFEKGEYNLAIYEWNIALSLDPSNEKARHNRDAAKLLFTQKIESIGNEETLPYTEETNILQEKKYYTKNERKPVAVKRQKKGLYKNMESSVLKSIREPASAKKDVAAIVSDNDTSVQEQRPIVLAQQAEENIKSQRKILLRKEKNEYIKKGKVHFDNKDYKLAVEAWEHAQEIDPDDRKIYFYIKDARKQFKKQQKKMAREEKAMKAKRLKDRRNIHLKKAGKFLANKNYEAAINEWKYALSIDPKNRTIKRSIRRAQARIIKQQKERVREEARLAKAKEEKAKAAAKAEARAKKKAAKAEKQLAKAQKKESKAKETELLKILIDRHLAQAKEHTQNEEYKAAIEEWRRVLFLDPDNRKVKFFIKNAKNRLAEQVEKREEQTRQIEARARKGKIDSYRTKAKAYARKKNYTAAIDEWQRALSLDPKNRTIKRYIERAKARLIRQEKEVQRAREPLAKQKEKEAGQEAVRAKEEARRERIRLPKAEEKAARAKTVKVKAKEAKSGQVEARARKEKIDSYRTKAKAYARKKNYTAAIDEWQRALSLDPKNRRIKTAIRNAKKKSEQAAKRAKMREEAGKKRERKSAYRAQVEKGKKYFLAKRYKEALDIWKQAKTLYPQDGTIKKYINKAEKNYLKQVQKTKGGVILRISENMPDVPRMMSVEECVEIGLKNSIALNVAERQVQLAKIRVWEARRKLLGKFSVRYENYKGTVGGEGYEGMRYLLDVDQPLYRGGELYFTMKQAKVNLEVVKNDYNRIRNDLVLKIKKAYYTLAKSIRNLDIQRELEQEVERVDRQIEALLKEGLTTKGEYLNIKSQHAQVIFQRTSARQDIDTAALILKQAMSVGPDHKIIINQELRPKARHDLKLAECSALALANRPEMKINHLMVEYYELERRINSAKEFPAIDLKGSLGNSGEWFGSEHPDTPRDSPRVGIQWFAGLKMKLPIFGNTAEYSYTREKWPAVVSSFQGTEAGTHMTKLNFLDNLKLYADKQESQIEYIRAKQEFEKSSNDITLEVRESFYSYRKALLQMDASAAKVEYQRQNLLLTKMRRGLDEILDSAVLESMIRLAQEEFGNISAIADYYIAIFSLNKAIGIEDYYKAE